jgi:hypothetical protein
LLTPVCDLPKERGNACGGAGSSGGANSSVAVKVVVQNLKFPIKLNNLLSKSSYFIIFLKYFAASVVL